MPSRVPAALALAVLLAAPAAVLAASHMSESSMPPSAEGSAGHSMHGGDMAVEKSGDPDLDFARAMIPHHEGAIEMAQMLIEEGQDPELRALAEAIILAQEAEIAFLRAWIEQHAPQ